MESCGRIQCTLIATSSSQVIYERFYERFSDVEKAAIRSAFQSAQRTLSADRPESVGRLRYIVTSLGLTCGVGPLVVLGCPSCIC
jgi:hypothetical protein